MLLAAYIILYVVEKLRKQQYIVIIKAYFIYLTVLALFAITLQNAGQHCGWYWNPEADSPGYMDTWTHITSPWLRFKRPGRFDFTALRCSHVLVDFELLFFLCMGQPLNHGVRHSYLFVLTVYPIATSLAAYSIERGSARRSTALPYLKVLSEKRKLLL